MSEKEVSEIRKRIEAALVGAGLGKNYDREIPALALAIYRAQIKKEKAPFPEYTIEGDI